MTTITDTLILPRPLVNSVLTHAQKHPDVEVCGLIGNDNSNNKTYYPVDNVSNNPSCRFLMDAPQQINAMRHMRENHQQLFAVVHSHPGSNAIPSDRDISENSYNNVYYLIISLNTKGVLEMRSYFQNDGKMNEVDVVLEEEQEL